MQLLKLFLPMFTLNVFWFGSNFSTSLQTNIRPQLWPSEEEEEGKKKKIFAIPYLLLFVFSGVGGRVEVEDLKEKRFFFDLRSGKSISVVSKNSTPPPLFDLRCIWCYIFSYNFSRRYNLIFPLFPWLDKVKTKKSFFFRSRLSFLAADFSRRCTGKRDRNV